MHLYIGHRSPRKKKGHANPSHLFFLGGDDLRAAPENFQALLSSTVSLLRAHDERIHPATPKSTACDCLVRISRHWYAITSFFLASGPSSTRFVLPYYYDACCRSCTRKEEASLVSFFSRRDLRAEAPKRRVFFHVGYLSLLLARKFLDHAPT